ncbi:MAG: RNA polymerase sigma factor SigZ [Calditrichaeota bacterium]|nr:RNA polymerase sigma factor SigZ [Calditrichota bacterium]
MIISTEEIWRDYHKRLHAYIFSYVKDREIANDILQDVFVKIHHSLDKLNDLSRLQSWLYRITKHTIIDHHRSQRFFDEISDDLLIEDDAEEQTDLKQLIGDWVRSAADQLSPEYRDVIIQSEFNHVPQTEIAKQSGISYSGIKSRIQRGREKIKDMILDCCHLDFDYFGNIYDYKCKRCECNYE